MLKTLLKKQLMEIFRGYFYDQKKNRARSRRATVLYVLLFAVLMLGVLGGTFTILALSLCEPLHLAGMDWLYFTMFTLVAVFLGAFGSVFNTYSQLYLAKDNDLLLSLPVSVSAVIASRLLGVYLMGLLYSAIVIVPAVIVYWITVPFTAAALIGGVLQTVLISVIVLLLSCLLGWVVARISLRLRHKSFITVIVSLIFFAAYYFVCFRAQELLSALIANAAAYGQSVQDSSHALYVLGLCGTGDWRAMLSVTAVVAAAAVLCWRLLAGSFLKIATAGGAAAQKKRVDNTLKSRSVEAALRQKELLRFTSSANYMLNCGLGVLFLLIGGVVLVLKGEALREMVYGLLGQRPDLLCVLLAAGVCMLASMNDMAVPSVSLEGKSLWALQSLPLAPWQVLRAKVWLQLRLSGIPTLFCAVCAAMVCAENPVQGVLLVLVCAAYTAFSALLCLSLGLKMVNLTWTSEIVPIKQNFNVMLALLIHWVYALVLGGGYLLIGGRGIGAEVYLLLFTALTAVGAALLRHWLKTRGAAHFAAL